MTALDTKLADPLTGEQRYRQATKLVQIRFTRRLRDFMAGRISILEGSDPRPEIIREFDRAYAIGFADGRAFDRAINQEK